MPLTTERRLHAASLVSAAVLLGACATAAGGRGPAEQAADQELAARVEYALLNDPRLYARHIDVDADRGVIRLSGLVWDDGDPFEARRIARAVPGVTSVVSELELVRGGKAR